MRVFRVDKEMLDRLPALEVVVKHGTGVNTIDLVETTARVIKVTNTPGRERQRGGHTSRE